MTADQLLAKAGLRCERVTNLCQVERLRRIRNVCRDGFSHHTGEIDQTRQADWWLFNEPHLRIWLYGDITEVEGAYLGFAMARQDEHGDWWATIAVLPEYRGLGYGKTLTAHLVRVAGVPLNGQARKDNPAAVKLHVAEDWDEVTCSDSLLRQFHAKALVDDVEGVPV